MPNLLSYLGVQLGDQLNSKLTLSREQGGPTCVIKWLETADALQLDQLRDVCVDALGTYLLSHVHQHLAAHKAALATLSGPTVAEVMLAIARCSNCVASASTMAIKCSSRCAGRSDPQYQKPRSEQRSCSVAACKACAFKPKQALPAAFTADVCSYCGYLRSFAWV